MMMLMIVSVVILGPAQRRPLLRWKYATAQKMNPKKESKVDDMMARKSPMLGMTLRNIS